LIEKIIEVKAIPINNIEAELLSEIKNELSLPIKKLITDLKPYEISSLVPSIAKANYKNP